MGKYILLLFVPTELRTDYSAWIREREGQFEYQDAGFDLLTPEDIVVPAGAVSHRISLGVRGAMYQLKRDECRPCAWYLYPRSSTGSKSGLRLANSVGIIDAGYRGEIMAIVDNVSDECKREKGARLFQACAPDIGSKLSIRLVDTIAELGYTERGERGFGSTGM